MCHQALFRIPREGLGTRLGIHNHAVVKQLVCFAVIYEVLEVK